MAHKTVMVEGLFSPGPLSAEDERALKIVERWYRIVVDNYDDPPCGSHVYEDQMALAHLRSRLSAPKASVSREWKYCSSCGGKIPDDSFCNCKPPTCPECGEKIDQLTCPACKHAWAVTED